MCTVSMVGDHYNDLWRQKPWLQSQPGPPTSVPNWIVPVEQVTRQEFDELKRQVEEMKALLKRAKAYDEANNEPDCEVDEKMETLRRVAKLVGVDLDEVIGKPAARQYGQGE